MRTCTTFPWTIENGGLALSSDLERDEQDAIATIFTRLPERIMRPYTAGTPEYIFETVTTSNLIANKLAIAIEEQCPTIAQCAGLGGVGDNGTVLVRLFWEPKEGPEQQTLTLQIT